MPSKFKFEESQLQVELSIYAREYIEYTETSGRHRIRQNKQVSTKIFSDHTAMKEGPKKGMKQQQTIGYIVPVGR